MYGAFIVMYAILSSSFSMIETFAVRIFHRLSSDSGYYRPCFSSMTHILVRSGAWFHCDPSVLVSLCHDARTVNPVGTENFPGSSSPDQLAKT